MSMKNRKDDLFGLNKMLGSILIDPQIAKRKKEDARRNSNDRYHAKKLAKELNIELTIEKDDVGWTCWIEYHVDQVGPEGWEDELFCRGWGEVRDKLTTIKQRREYLEMGPDDRQQADLDELFREEEQRHEIKMKVLKIRKSYFEKYGKPYVTLQESRQAELKE
jgi:hypothetical protein